jgi:succinoglycan biosynthesis transport protein ExoP
MQRLPNDQVELGGIVYPDTPYPGYDPQTRERNRRRIGIFLIVVIVSLLIGFSYTFLRPAVYESSATLLITPPAIDERANDVTNAQHVELELQFMTRHALLSEVLDTLSAEGQRLENHGFSLSDLQEMLVAIPVENTNLVRLTARGKDRYLLPVVLNTWIEVYQAAHSEAFFADSGADTEEIDQQLGDIKGKVEEKRQELYRFRKNYDIVSMEREENRILRQLSGLTESLNKATDENVAAQARFDAIRSAIEQGKPVATEHGKDSLTNLETRLVEIEEQLSDLSDEFTPRYMSADPQIRALVKKRDLLEDQIRKKRREGQQGALATAEQDVTSTGQRVTSLQQQLEEHKQHVMEFTSRFSEHEALQEELLQLESVYREAQDRQLHLQVNAHGQYAQVTVKEWPFLPERPVYPHYLRDAAISVAASLLAGLLLVLLYDFLTPPARHPLSAGIRQVFVASPENRLLDKETRAPMLQAATAPVLEHQLPRELSQEEIKALFRVASADIRLLLTSLLSGLDVDEARLLRWDDIDTDEGIIHAGGASGRTLPFTPPLATAIADCRPPDPDAVGAVWHDDNGEPLVPDDLAAMLLFTAHDAGLSRPREVTPEVIRHTYISYLVRQGARLNELPVLVGPVPPGLLASYSAYSPPGSALPLDSVELVCPAVDDFYRHATGNGTAPEEPAC